MLLLNNITFIYDNIYVSLFKKNKPKIITNIYGISLRESRSAKFRGNTESFARLRMFQIACVYICVIKFV